MLSYNDTSKENEEEVKIVFKRTLAYTVMLFEYKYCDTLWLSLIQLDGWKGKGRKEGLKKGRKGELLISYLPIIVSFPRGKAPPLRM